MPKSVLGGMFGRREFLQAVCSAASSCMCMPFPMCVEAYVLKLKKVIHDDYYCHVSCYVVIQFICLQERDANTAQPGAEERQARSLQGVLSGDSKACLLEPQQGMEGILPCPPPCFFSLSCLKQTGPTTTI